MLGFGAATTIQSIALRGHPKPYFNWFQQPVRICASSCRPDAREWRRVRRSVINPSSKVRSRVSSLFLPPSKSGYFFRCVAENSLGQDEVVYLVHRMGKNLFIDSNCTAVKHSARAQYGFVAGNYRETKNKTVSKRQKIKPLLEREALKVEYLWKSSYLFTSVFNASYFFFFFSLYFW